MSPFFVILIPYMLVHENWKPCGFSWGWAAKNGAVCSWHYCAHTMLLHLKKVLCTYQGPGSYKQTRTECAQYLCLWRLRFVYGITLVSYVYGITLVTKSKKKFSLMAILSRLWWKIVILLILARTNLDAYFYENEKIRGGSNILSISILIIF